MKDLKSARAARVLTQAQAAARLGVSQSYLAMLERGTRPLTPEVARRAIRTLGLAPTALSPRHTDATRRQSGAHGVAGAKLRDLQNRLGFVVTLARGVAERAGDGDTAAALADLEAQLERSRLAREETLCRPSLSEAERRWLAKHRSADARRWNLLTDWTVDALRYAG